MKTLFKRLKYFFKSRTGLCKEILRQNRIIEGDRESLRNASAEIHELRHQVARLRGHIGWAATNPLGTHVRHPGDIETFGMDKASAMVALAVHRTAISESREKEITRQIIAGPVRQYSLRELEDAQAETNKK